MSFLLNWAIKDARMNGIFISHQREKACRKLEDLGWRFAIDYGYETALEIMQDIAAGEEMCYERGAIVGLA